jgi:hypothetical protein
MLHGRTKFDGMTRPAGPFPQPPSCPSEPRFDTSALDMPAGADPGVADSSRCGRAEARASLPPAVAAISIQRRVARSHGAHRSRRFHPPRESPPAAPALDRIRHATRVRDDPIRTEEVSAWGGNDRVTVRPENLMRSLQQQLAQFEVRHDRGFADGFGEVWFPNVLAT